MRPAGLVPGVDKAQLVRDVREALFASKICSYAQGMNLIRAKSEEQGWGLNLGELARIWKGGCIIRAQFLDDIKQAYDRDPKRAPSPVKGAPPTHCVRRVAVSCQRRYLAAAAGAGWRACWWTATSRRSWRRGRAAGAASWGWRSRRASPCRACPHPSPTSTGARGSGAIRECLRECKQSGAIRECLRARADSAAAPRRVARSYRRARMPANLVQAQRDYFGSHTYERTDMGGWHHTLWSDGNSADSITTTAYNN